MNRTLTAQELRKRSTPAERHLWAQLRAHRLNGYYFRRQYPIGRYVVDFICRRHGVIVEVDGEYHRQQVAADIERMRHLEALGYTVVRFRNEEVFTRIECVLKLFFLTCTSPPPPQRRGVARHLRHDDFQPDRTGQRIPRPHGTDPHRRSL